MKRRKRNDGQPDSDTTRQRETQFHQVFEQRLSTRHSPRSILCSAMIFRTAMSGLRPGSVSYRVTLQQENL
jgi:hypothetical protein